MAGQWLFNKLRTRATKSSIAMMNSKKVTVFEVDKNAGKEHVRKYGNGKGETPEKNL